MHRFIYTVRNRPGPTCWLWLDLRHSKRYDLNASVYHHRVMHIYFWPHPQMSFVSLFIVIYVLSVFVGVFSFSRYTKIHRLHTLVVGRKPPLQYFAIVTQSPCRMCLFIYEKVLCSDIVEHVFDAPISFIFLRLALVALMQWQCHYN